jgi:hypothetical protein
MAQLQSTTINGSINVTGTANITGNIYPTTVATAGQVMKASATGVLEWSSVASAYTYKGSVSTYSNLPSTGVSIGDVYNVEDTGMNYAWTGTKWDALGATYTFTSGTAAGVPTNGTAISNIVTTSDSLLKSVTPSSIKATTASASSVSTSAVTVATGIKTTAAAITALNTTTVYPYSGSTQNYSLKSVSSVSTSDVSNVVSTSDSLVKSVSSANATVTKTTIHNPTVSFDSTTGNLSITTTDVSNVISTSDILVKSVTPSNATITRTTIHNPTVTAVTNVLQKNDSGTDGTYVTSVSAGTGITVVTGAKTTANCATALNTTSIKNPTVTAVTNVLQKDDSGTDGTYVTSVSAGTGITVVTGAKTTANCATALNTTSINNPTVTAVSNLLQQSTSGTTTLLTGVTGNAATITTKSITPHTHATNVTVLTGVSNS